MFASSVQNSASIWFGSAELLLRDLALFFPSFLGIAIFVFFGWLIALVLRHVVGDLLDWSGFTASADRARINTILARAGFRRNINFIIINLVYWTILLFFVSSGLEMLGLYSVAHIMNKLIDYIPHIIIGTILFIITLMLAKYARTFVLSKISINNIAFGKVISVIVEMSVIVAGFSISLAHFGINIKILALNISIIIIGIIVFIIIALWSSGATLFANLLGGYFTRRIYKKGDNVVIAGYHGVVKDIMLVAVILDTAEGDIVIPNEEIMKQGSI
jgi:hypothetical protein